MDTRRRTDQHQRTRESGKLHLKRLALPILTVTLLALSTGASASDGVYKWVDEEGEVHFGAKPPEGSNAETIRAPSPKPEIDHSIDSTKVSVEVFHKDGVAQSIVAAVWRKPSGKSASMGGVR